MDIVEFAEVVCNFHLTSTQKEYLRFMYDAVKHNKQLVYVPARGSSRVELRLLQALAIIKVAQESGLVKEEKGEVK